MNINEKHRILRKKISNMVREYEKRNNMSSEEVLAIFAYMTGQVLALQDRRTMTMERANQIILRNIELGNQEVVMALANANPAGQA